MNRTNALLASIQAVSPELHVQGAAGAAGAAAAAAGAAGAPVAGAWAIAHVAIDSTIAIMHHIDLSIVDLAFLCHTETPTTDIALHGPPAKLCYDEEEHSARPRCLTCLYYKVRAKMVNNSKLLLKNELTQNTPKKLCL
jgi:hypothetical protein